MIPGNPSQMLKLAGIRRYAALRGWEVVCVTRDELRGANVRDILARLRPLGVIVEGSGCPFLYSPSAFGTVPAAYIEYPMSETAGRAPNVTIDDDAMADAAFRELSLGKPAAFAAVGHINPHLWSRLRIRAFRRRCAKDGYGCIVFPARKGESLEGRDARLAEWVAALPPRTAVFVGGDTTAIALASAARAALRNIPKDITVCSACNIDEISGSATPPATSIQLDFERMGYVAARALGKIISHGGTEPRRKDCQKHQLSIIDRNENNNLRASVSPCDKKTANPAILSKNSAPQREPGVIQVGPLLTVRRKSTSGRGRHEPWIARAVEIIRAEACEGLTIDELLGRLKTVKGEPVSRRNFDRRFREAMGHTANEEILSVRLESACALLAQTDTPVTAIHDFCGFGCYSNLDALFRSRFKMSMRKWRERNAR